MDHSSTEQKTPKSITRFAVTILLILIPLLGAAGIAFVWLTLHPKHLVSGVIHIAPTQRSPLDPEPKPFDRDAYAAYVRTQAVMLSSGSVLQKVADSLAGRKLTFFSAARMPVSAEPGGPDRILRKAIADGVIKIAPIPDTELLEITMLSEKEQEAAMIVDSFLLNYKTTAGMVEEMQTSGNLRWLEKALVDASGKMADVRARLRALTKEGSETHPDVRADIDAVWSLQLQLKLNEELCEKIRRRLQEIEFERDSPPRISLAHLADFKGLVDNRRQWTFIVLGATLLLSVVLLIARRVLRPRS
jgi:hypothetical protein